MISASTNDGLPSYICDKCKGCLVFLEKVAVDHEDLGEQARNAVQCYYPGDCISVQRTLAGALFLQMQ